MQWTKHLFLWLSVITSLLLTPVCFSYIDQVRVVNDTKVNIYIHAGGFPASKKIAPGKWHVFKYPFPAKKPNSLGEVVNTGLLVVTAGGNWITTPHGYTYLSKPKLVQCLDYSTKEHKEKTGNRVWTIKGLSVNQDCYRNHLKGYKQKWYTEP